MQSIEVNRWCKTLSALCMLLVIAFLPVPVAAEEGNNKQIPSLVDEIDKALTSALKKNPDLKNCRVTVNIDFEKDIESDMWKGKLFNILAETGDPCQDETGETTPANSEVIPVTNTEEYDSEADEDDDDNSERGNVLGWILGALCLIVLAAVFSRFKPKLLKQFEKSSGGFSIHAESHRQSKGKGNSRTNTKRQNPEAPQNPREENVSKPQTEQQKVEVRKEDESPKSSDIPSVQEDVVETPVHVEEETEPVRPVPLAPIKKYGRIAVLSQDELTTEEDYLSDDTSGMPFEFVFSPNMEQGTYDIASSSRVSFLRDINVIRPFVQDFDDVSNPTKIVTVSKGKLNRKGLSWEVTEKLKIQLL